MPIPRNTLYHHRTRPPTQERWPPHTTRRTATREVTPKPGVPADPQITHSQANARKQQNRPHRRQASPDGDP